MKTYIQTAAEKGPPVSFWFSSDANGEITNGKEARPHNRKHQVTLGVTGMTKTMATKISAQVYMQVCGRITFMR